MIYANTFTGTKAHRTELDKLLKELKTGDKLIVTKLDRLARSATQGIGVVQSLLDHGVIIHVLNIELMNNTPTGKLICSILLAFAEFERDLVERTQEGKAIAKQKPGFKEGRPKQYGKMQIQHALELLKDHS